MLEPLAQPPPPGVVAGAARERDVRARPRREHRDVRGGAAEVRDERVAPSSDVLGDQVDERLAEAEHAGRCHVRSRYPRGRVGPNPVDEHTFTTDRGPVFYRSAPGADDPPLYLHGIPTSSDDWIPFLELTGGSRRT